MPRVSPLRPRPTAVAGLILATALAAGACQTAPAVPELTDPREILAAAVTTAGTARTVRIDAKADGTVTVDLLGLGTASPIELTGTTISADLDIEGGDGRATFAAPGLLGVTGEVIALDGTPYVKTSLTGPLYQVQPTGGGEVPTPSGEARASIVKDIIDFLANPALEPVKGEDTACGNSTCYRVEISLGPEDLAALGADDLEAPVGLPVPVPIPDLSAATVDLTVLVTKDTTRLSGVEATVDLGGGAGVATADMTFSKWDDDVSISAPPADQVAPAN